MQRYFLIAALLLFFPQAALAGEAEKNVVEIVKRGEIYEKEISPDLYFRLIPSEYGWTISVGEKGKLANNFSAVVTPPYRGTNPLLIEGWHFRNADNSGPNVAGDKNVNVPQEERSFEFVMNGQDYKAASDCLEKMLWGYSYTPEEVDQATQTHAALKKGHGVLIIHDLKLYDLEPGQKAGISEMQFTVRFDFKLDVELAGFGCTTGFGGWTEPPREPNEETACDIENIKTFQTVLNECHNGDPMSQAFKFDGDKDGCVTCKDFEQWKKLLNSLFEKQKRSTSGEELNAIECPEP